ncbi:MAG: ABC transporter substrate-binding protein [Chloroflexi bacterium]|nr:ABC transporter substrate-binding protein [Chloroflexota bacterium]
MKRILWFLFGVSVLAVLALSACAAPAQPPAAATSAPAAATSAPVAATSAPAAPKAAAPDYILIGGSVPETGMYAGFGQGGVWGAQAAVDDINAQGGIYIKAYDKKIPVKLVLADNASDPSKSGTLAEDLILRDKVVALFSPDNPPPMHIPIAETAEKYGIPHVVGGGPLEPWLEARNSTETKWQYTWFSGFGIATPPPQGDPRYGKPGYTIKDAWFAVLDAYGNQTNKVAGVFATDEPDGIGWYNLFPGLLKEWGATVVGADQKLGFYPVGTTDFTSMCTAWKKANVEILWGNTPGPEFGPLWRQCTQLGFHPKIVMVGRAPLFYTDVNSWGGDLPQGVGSEVWWDPAFTGPGIGTTTPQSLADRWAKATNQPLNRGIGHGYTPMQVLFDAIQRAGSLDGKAINAALADTNMQTINYLVKFDPATHFSWIPVFVGQWQKTDKPWVWESPITFSKHDFLPATAKYIFPVPGAPAQ